MIFRTLLAFAKIHVAEIVTVASCAGVVGTAVVASHDAVKTNKEIIRETLNRFDPTNSSDDAAPLTVKEKASIAVKNYWPTALTVGFTVGTIIFSHVYHIKTEKNLIAAAALSETLLQKYESKISVKYGPEEARQIREEIIGEVVEGMCDDIHQSYGGDGNKMLCYDPYTKTFFKASQVDLLLAEMEVNRTLMNGGGTSIWAYLANFDPKYAERVTDTDIGWWMDDSYDWEASYFGFYCGMITQLEEVEGREALVVYFNHDPMEPGPEFL